VRFCTFHFDETFCADGFPTTSCAIYIWRIKLELDMSWREDTKKQTGHSMAPR
jgi:hypothetical protein